MERIILQNVYKTFDMVNTTNEKIKYLLSFKPHHKSFLALRDVSLKISSGEVVGLLGMNGSGKSTLSNLISEIIYPNSGQIEVNGDVAIIAVSQGLKGVLTGRENIHLKCLMLGMTEEEIDNRMDEIIEFADIGEFIDQPIKKYSSGMKSRLGFAIAINVNADILIIDEALSVGDQTFYNKCIDKMNEFKNEGKTIIFVSHNLSQVSSFCDRAIWLEFGRVKMDGEAQEIVKYYTDFLNHHKSLSPKEQKQYKTNLTKDSTNTPKSIKTKKANKRELFGNITFSLVLFLMIIFNAMHLF